jgi:hypothetical protein
MIGSVAVLLSGVYLWMHGYQNGWVIAMIVLGVIGAVTNE